MNLSKLQIVVCLSFIFSSIGHANNINGEINNFKGVGSIPLIMDQWYVQSFDEITSDDEFIVLDYDPNITYNKNITLNMARDDASISGGTGLSGIGLTISYEAYELEARKEFFICEGESIFWGDRISTSITENAKGNFSESCVYANDQYTVLNLFYASCNDICIEVSYGFDYLNFKSTDTESLNKFGNEFLSNIAKSVNGDESNFEFVKTFFN